ncbi:MAG: hypothetical protein GY906_22290 [bacterium]|nr:hypothetical protein [bacterium]
MTNSVVRPNHTVEFRYDGADGAFRVVLLEDGRLRVSTRGLKADHMVVEPETANSINIRPTHYSVETNDFETFKIANA